MRRKEDWMNKTLTIVAGANGSGKTTFALEFCRVHNLAFINADEIAKSLDPQDITRYKVSAGKQFFDRFAELIGGENPFVIESTLSGGYLQRLIAQAKDRGFAVSLIYLFVENPQSCIDRIQIRVLNGGHFVPAADVVRRYHRSKRLFWERYRALCDAWFLYYNANEDFELVADSDTVFDELKLQEFLKDAQ